MKMDCKVERLMEAAPYGVRCAIGFSISNAEYSVTTTLVYLKKYAEIWLRDYIVAIGMHKKTRQCTVHVTLSRVRETIVAMESDKYYVF